MAPVCTTNLVIALGDMAGDDIAARMQLVNRALVAGHRAQLFTWPPAESQPLPSPLREALTTSSPPSLDLT